MVWLAGPAPSIAGGAEGRDATRENRHEKALSAVCSTVEYLVRSFLPALHTTAGDFNPNVTTWPGCVLVWACAGLPSPLRRWHV